MSELAITKNSYELRLDQQTGLIIGLFDKSNPGANWAANGDGYRFGAVFLAGAQDKETDIRLNFSPSERQPLKWISESGATSLVYEALPDQLLLCANLPVNCGPRIGIELDMNLINMNGNPLYQCMPCTIYTSPETDYAYFIFSTPDGRYMTLTIQADFAAWRIKYSYWGHRMAGFQILSQADDVITKPGQMLKTTDALRIGITFSNDFDMCWEDIANKLGIAIARFPVTGGMIGASLRMRLVGDCKNLIVLNPDGGASEARETVTLSRPGVYRVQAESESGRTHTSYVLCHEKWENLFDRANDFHRRYFQHPGGAFYRVIWKDSLSPENGITLEGIPFGDPRKTASCRSGEFGGFAAWAMIKNCLLFGQKPEIMESAGRYINGWALNRGHEDDPWPGTIYKQPDEFLGRKYGAYHVYRDVNYPQHEVWIAEELADYYTLTGDSGILPDLAKLCCHFIDEHVRGDGMVVCQNTPDDAELDYTGSVWIATALLRSAEVIDDPMVKAKILDALERISDYICARGFSTQYDTEGEPCTEEATYPSIASLLVYAYERLKPKPEYIELARRMLDFHGAMEMRTEDCRTNGSSLRTWETQYETRDWGPSINAGHAWTLHTAEAKILLGLHDRNVRYVLDAYNMFVANICKMEPNGAMPSCYTPDMIPGVPHKCALFGSSALDSGELIDLRPTSSVLAMDYVRNTYAASGNYWIIKAAEFWSHISALSVKDAAAANGTLSGSLNGSLSGYLFTSGAPLFDCLLLDSLPAEPLTIKCFPGKKLVLLFENETEADILGGQTEIIQGGVTVIPDGDKITVRKGCR